MTTPDNLWIPSNLEPIIDVESHSWYDIKQQCTRNVTNDKNKIKLNLDNNQKKFIDELFDLSITAHNWMIELINKRMAVNVEQSAKSKIDNINASNLELNSDSEPKPESEIELVQTILDNYAKTNVNYNIIKYVVTEIVMRILNKLKSAQLSIKQNLSKSKIRFRPQKPENRFKIKIRAIDIKHIFPNELSAYDNNLCTIQRCSKTNEYTMMIQISSLDELVCGIDLGIRTFATIYSKDKTYSIGNDTEKILNKYLFKIDKISNLLSDPSIRSKKRSRMRNRIEKSSTKIDNMINELHLKTSHEILRNYNIVYIGLFRTNSIKNDPHNERLIKILNPDKFRQILKSISKKYGARVIEINEYLTTKTCSNCGKINEVGRKKIYQCDCAMVMDRDKNAAKNILKIGLCTKKILNLK